MEGPSVLGGAVEGRVGLDDPPGDRVLVRVDESCQVHGSAPLLGKAPRASGRASPPQPP